MSLSPELIWVVGPVVAKVAVSVGALSLLLLGWFATRGPRQSAASRSVAAVRRLMRTSAEGPGSKGELDAAVVAFEELIELERLWRIPCQVDPGGCAEPTAGEGCVQDGPELTER